MARKKPSQVWPSDQYALVKKFPDGWYYRLGSSTSYPWLGPFLTQHVAERVREGATGGSWGTAKRAHAKTKDLSAVEEALGWTPEPEVVERAEAKYGDYSTNELRQELRSLEDQFEMSGGRGVSLADRLDAARIALALRGSKKSHATKKAAARARPVTASKETSVLPPSVRVARAGLESVREHGIKNLRYGLYRHASDRAYQWGNFTGTPEHVITAVVPNAKNTTSQEALVRALKWKR